MRIGIDIDGGDFAPESPIIGSALALSDLPDYVKLVLIGNTETINKVLDQHQISLDPSRVELVHAPEIVTMHDHPTKVFSQKPNSSLSIGFKMLKEGQLQAFASVGNTGAMMVGSMFSVKTIPGVIRPCITSALPKENGGVNIILDVGTNADCKPDVLYQFAILGSLFAQHVYNIEAPKVGLLNIGEEPEKGNLLTQATHIAMKESSSFNFIGNIEGRDLFSDKVDVIVCDGFTGNVVLKEAEAFYAAIKRRGIDDPYFNKFNYELYGGTPILGINSSVLIGHGISSPLAIKNMLLLAKDTVEAGLTEKIKSAFL